MSEKRKNTSSPYGTCIQWLGMGNEQNKRGNHRVCEMEENKVGGGRGGRALKASAITGTY